MGSVDVRHRNSIRVKLDVIHSTQAGCQAGPQEMTIPKGLEAPTVLLLKCGNSRKNRHFRAALSRMALSIVHILCIIVQLPT